MAEQTVDQASSASRQPDISSFLRDVETKGEEQLGRITEAESKQKNQLSQLISQGDDFLSRIGEIKAPKQPEFKPLPQSPDTQYKDPIQSLGSMASVLAILGSLKTRAPLTAALNAAAGSMQGFHKGDQERVKLEREKFNDELNVALKQNQEELQQYQTALESAQFDLGKAASQWRVIASQTQNQAMLATIESGDPKRMYDHLMGVAKLGTELLKTQMSHIDKSSPFAKELRDAGIFPGTPEWDKAFRARISKETSPTATMINIGKDKTPDLTDEDMNFWADRVLGGGQVPNLGWDKETRKKLYRRIAERGREKGIDAADSLSNQAMFRGESNAISSLSRLGAQVLSFEGTAIRNLDVAMKEIDKYARAGVPIIDRAGNLIRRNLGDRDFPALQTALVTVRNEYAKISTTATAAGVGGTRADREEIDHLLSADMTIDQLKRVIEVMRKDMNNRRDAIEEEKRTLEKSIKGRVSGTPNVRSSDQDLINKWLK